jgi:hypothetical protein
VLEQVSDGAQVARGGGHMQGHLGVVVRRARRVQVGAAENGGKNFYELSKKNLKACEKK